MHEDVADFMSHAVELEQTLRSAAVEAASERRALEGHSEGLAVLLQEERSTSGGLRSRLGDEAQLASELRACRKESAVLQAQLQQLQLEEERLARGTAEERVAASTERQQLLQQLLQQSTAAERERTHAMAAAYAARSAHAAVVSPASRQAARARPASCVG